MDVEVGGGVRLWGRSGRTQLALKTDDLWSGRDNGRDKTVIVSDISMKKCHRRCEHGETDEQSSVGGDMSMGKSRGRFFCECNVYMGNRMQVAPSSAVVQNVVTLMCLWGETVKNDIRLQNQNENVADLL